MMREISQDPTGILKNHGILWKHPQTGKGMWSSAPCTGATQTGTLTRPRFVCWTPNIRHLTVKHYKHWCNNHWKKKKRTWSHGHGDLLSSFEDIFFCRCPSYPWSKFDGTLKRLTAYPFVQTNQTQNYLVIHVQTYCVLCHQLATVT